MVSGTSTPTFQAPERFSRLAGDSLAYSFGTFFGKGIALVLLPIVARALDPDGFGRLETLSTAFTALAAFLLLGFDVSSARAFSLLAPAQRRAVTSTWLIITVFLAAAVTAACFAGQSQIAGLLLDDESQRLAARWIGPIVAVSLLRSFVLGTLRNEGLPWAHALVNGVSISLTAVLMAVAATATATVESLLKAQAVGVGFVALFGILYVSRFITTRPTLDAAAMILRLGVPLAPLITFVALGELATRAVLLRTADESEVGQLGVAIRVGSIVTVFVAGALVAFQPRAFRQSSTPGSERKIGQDIERLFSILCIAAVALAFVTPVLVAIVGGSAFEPATRIAGLVLVSALGAGLFQLLSVGSMIDGRTGRISLATGIGVAITIIFVLGLTPSHGALGAGVAMAIGSWLSVVVIQILSRHDFTPHIAWVHLVPLAVIAALSIILMTNSTPGLLRAAAITVVALALRATSVPSDARALVRELVGKRGVANG